MAQCAYRNPMREPMALNSSVHPAIDPPFEPSSSPFRFGNGDLRAGPTLRSESTESPEATPAGASVYVDLRAVAPVRGGDAGDASDAQHRYRTIWLSDIHLGSGGCQAQYLLDFLRHHESEYLYLVCDIIDGWQLCKGWFWPQAHNDVVQKILRKARKGTQAVYIPGNHDEAARQFCDLTFGDIHLRGEAFHTTLAGKRLWIVHGDLFDGVIQHAKWLAYLGDTTYTVILLLNRWFNRVRTKLGFDYWPLSQYLKHQVKNAVDFISQFERVMTDEARRRGCDGVVCGHIHKAEIRDIDGILYCNDGDWVENLSALVET
ncbi:Ser/Thr protein phosphatase family protein,UDP-2,3-diacylglucosamine hydrolase homolog [Candidatus Paraburkholderia kirkii UZHbot1]|uniref:Ser/Thr protein phosphatase family protein,UDP-2,3-diacylglucosamine hydrolase homolog n=1 Tax=Candidatus Paraburkholderia kirkii UZHbot1 TaxID=1055526 RepID=G4MFI5_9BURK|nr:Ser/Thr protein phosphatase family protein,UDP-2,3-diacylglucosamine hydrolase homolog [Candidatus Paraburkholderia kirkii UZHbot1]